MIQKGLVDIQIDPNDTEERFCEVCAAGKPTMKPFPKELFTHAKEFGERVHWDSWGLTSVKNLGGKSYTAVCKDDATQTVKPHFLAKKSKTFNLYKQDKAWILNHGGRPTSYTHFDHGGEFMSNEFNQHLENKGTQHELTVHDSPPQMEYLKEGCVLVVKQHTCYSFYLDYHILYGQKLWCMDAGSKTRCQHELSKGQPPTK